MFYQLASPLNYLLLMTHEEKWEKKKKKKMLQKINTNGLFSVVSTQLLPNLIAFDIMYLINNKSCYINDLINSYNYINLPNSLRFISFYKTFLISRLLSKKLKLRKWKYKKKKINKFKILRKIRKILIHKKYKKRVPKFLISIASFLNKVKIVSKIPLTNRIPLTERVIQNSYLEFFYKHNKDGSNIDYNYNNFLTIKSYEDTVSSDLTIFLRNYNQKPYWKLRLARISHWNFFFKQKTIKEQRYKTFLPQFLKNQHNFTNLNIYLLTFFTSMQVSWTRAQRVSSFLKKTMVFEATNCIFFLPKVFSRVINWKFFKKKSYRLRKKVGRWSYLNYKRWQSPWLQKKKNFPKKIKHLKPIFNILKSLTHYDPITGYLLFFNKPNKYELSFTESFKINTLIKLHMYRYNSN